MPWYDYHCESCERDFEAQQPIDARDDAACPHCASRQVKRAMPRIAVLVRAGGGSASDEGCACGAGAPGAHGGGCGCGCCAGLN